MKNIIMVTNDSEASLDNMRVKEVSSLIARMKFLEGHECTPQNSGEKILNAISKLDGKLSYDIQPGKIIARYVPSVEAKKQLMDVSVNKEWDEGIVKKQQKMIRMTQGAVFRFPLEDGNGTIDAFITDWSPFPVAAAMAVHKDHTAVSSVRREEEDYFTGLFVRHPLTGDIIPVFVANWVKPEFGTGAVIINPAHNQADLDFARKIGLPIRFGLVPDEVTAMPSTWPNAPVIKMGHTTKTGRFDNLIPEEAVKKYFDELHEFGHADRVTDIGVGAYPVFELELSETGDYGFDIENRKIVACVNEEVFGLARGRLHPSPVLSEIAAMDAEGETVIVSQTGEVGNALLFTRCLYYDIHGKVLVPQQVIQVQKVEGTKQTEGMDEEVLRLAVLGQAPNSQPAVLKKQIMEQVERFVKNHREMKAAFETAVPEEREVNSGQYIKVKEAMEGADCQKAFNGLYAIQKTLYQGIGKGVVPLQALKLYFALAYVLFGAESPNSVDVSGEWMSM